MIKDGNNGYKKMAPAHSNTPKLLFFLLFEALPDAPPQHYLRQRRAVNADIPLQ